MSKRTKRPLTEGRILHIVRQAEKSSGTGATGFTLLKMMGKPIARLVDDKKIGPEELQAAGDIQLAFHSLTIGLGIRPIGMERVDKVHSHVEPAAIVDSQRRYRNWSAHWSLMRKSGDRTMEVVIAAVVDERPFYLIEDDIGLRHGKAKQATVRGLRDYAARAGWVRGKVAEQWKAEAANTFHRVHPMLAAAIQAAK